ALLRGEVANFPVLHADAVRLGDGELDVEAQQLTQGTVRRPVLRLAAFNDRAGAVDQANGNVDQNLREQILLAGHVPVQAGTGNADGLADVLQPGDVKTPVGDHGGGRGKDLRVTALSHFGST